MEVFAIVTFIMRKIFSYETWRESSKPSIGESDRRSRLEKIRERESKTKTLAREYKIGMIFFSDPDQFRWRETKDKEDCHYSQ